MSAPALAGAALVALLPITNPIGAVAAFAGLTSGDDPAQVRRQAPLVALYVFAILGVFALLGSLVLDAFGISLPALQIAGGLVVGHSGFGMLNQRAPITTPEADHAVAKTSVAFSPMALPLVAGPGAIGVVTALSARNPGVESRLALVVAAAGIAVVIGLALRFATPLIEKLGPSGVGALSRVMGFLILAIGVELVAHGVLALHG
ncbi:MarC family protein [Nocardioides maradonensis]